LATALGVAQALEEVIQIPIQVKWPNDVLLGGRKVAGILLEAFPSGLIIGIGVNVATTRETFPPEIRDKATSIYEETGMSVSRARILRNILEKLEHFYERLLKEGFEAIREAWTQRDITYGARVVLRRSEGVVTGLALGPSADGTLYLKTSQGIERIHSGEILLWEIPGWETRAA
jgi:BirA family biotin operon repressor/biotin-[acetyl-CoA-carboxylase] ligase